MSDDNNQNPVNDVKNDNDVKTTAEPKPAPVPAPVVPTVVNDDKADVAPVIAPVPVVPAAPVAPVVPVVDKDAEKKAASEAKKAEKEAKKQEKKNAKAAEKRAKIQAKIDACPREYKPLSTSKCFWLLIIGGIPVIGIITSLILSIVPFNKNVKYMEKALFALHLVGIILTLIGLLVAVFVGGAEVKDIFGAFLDFFEELAHAVSM